MFKGTKGKNKGNYVQELGFDSGTFAVKNDMVATISLMKNNKSHAA